MAEYKINSVTDGVKMKKNMEIFPSTNFQTFRE